MCTTNEIIYREPVPEDAEKIVDFYNFVGGETFYLSFQKDEYPMNAEQQREEILATNAHPASIMILAMDGDEIAGIGTIHSGNKIKSRHQGELGIVVAKKYQKQGIGTEIMRRLIEFCKGNGITTRIQLDTLCANEIAVKLYERFGFEIEGRLRNNTLVDGVYYDLYVMGLLL
ncbi:MAG: GNAT family N-acetyltransferase [Dorea sp.]|nr:GNAT family N-acetyltransferase [Dorea sp.]MDY2813756.1 GNAT family protein [Dorea sp.]